MSSIAEWMNLLDNFGFLVAITVYLISRFYRKIEELESAIRDLSEAIKKLRG